MKNLQKKPVLCALFLLMTITGFAKLPIDAPLLPPPTGTVITVSNWDELINAVWSLQSNTTIVLQPGTYTIPEWWFINVGIDQGNAIENIVIRGATGNYDDVIIKGSSPGMYGTSPFGFFINNATNVTIADLTVGEVAHHAVQLNPPVIGAADGIRLYHCRFYDSGEQLVKGNFLYDNENLPAGVRNGRIEYCLIEYSSWGPLDGYTEGIDLHACDNWTIQHNLFRNIRVHENEFHTHVPAVLIWNNSKNVDVLDNTFINCDRGIAFGLLDQTTYNGFPEVNTGVICNNMIYRQQDSVFYDDAGILAWDVRNVSIINNSVLDENYDYPPIEYRFVKENSNIVIANNLVSPTTNGFRPAIWDRDNSGGDPQNDYQNATVLNNFTGASDEFFILSHPGDLHLQENYADSLFGIDTYPNCPTDFDENLRGEITNYGADHAVLNIFDVLATHSFTNYDGGTHPNSITLNGNQLTVNLSSIAGASIFRAVLNPGRNFNYYDLTENPFYQSTMTLSCDGSTLQLLPPRYKTFDATAAAVNSFLTGNILTIIVDDPGAGFGNCISLEVLCNASLPAPIEQVTSANARFINGDAFITFQEVNTPIAIDQPTYLEFNSTYQNVMNGNIRYRIYKSNHPINGPTDIINAELVDEIYPLSGWNPELEGPERVFPYMGQDGIVTRLPVDNGVLADIGTGIYVNRYKGGQNGDTAWYFISHAVDGAEDFTAIVPGMNLTNSVEETQGTGVVFLCKTQHETDYMYEPPSTLYFYTKWECPPAAAFPNEASNYLVGLRDDFDYSSFQPGVSLKLHCWGGNLTDNCSWWFGSDQGHILVSGNQFPFQTWWVGHHSSLGTLKSCDEGTVQPFTPFRLMNFIYDFLQPEYDIDTTKIILSGSSMGGSGTSMIGIRNGHLFSHLNGWVGVHDSGNTPTFQGSYEVALGDSSWHCNYSNNDFTAKYGGIEVKPEDNYDVWDYFNNAKWLDTHPTVEIPWHTFSNGVNDDAIGWPQAVEYVQALIEHKLPFNFTWGQNGHSQRAMVLASYGYEWDRNSLITFSSNQSFPVFSNASSNSDLLNDPEGQINNYFFWETESIKDTADNWEVNISLSDRSPENSVVADVTPRKLQYFSTEPGLKYVCSWYENETLLASDTITADDFGLVTFGNLEITKSLRKMVISSFPGHTINIPAGWSGISSYIVPNDNDIEDLFDNMNESLIYLGNLSGIYFPELEINTLHQWDSHSGYVIKTSAPTSISIEGGYETNLTIQLASGWNLIPVLSPENVNAETLFAPLGDSFEVASEVAGMAVYWPEFQITTLRILQPGKSYFIRVNQPCLLHFQPDK
jgi:hypothetical protein